MPKFRDKLLDRYRVLRVFNNGGMAKGVYYCEDLDIRDAQKYSQAKRKEVIVKVLEFKDDSDRSHERIRQEAATQRSLNHKNLVRVYDVVEKDDLLYVVMEYVPGKTGGGNTLASLIDEAGVMSRPQAIFIFQQILEGMKALQSGKNRIIHLDMKPENVLITNDTSEVKIADFGISTILSRDNSVLSEEEVTRGSAGYVSPLFMYEKGEKGHVPVCEQYDYFALGVIFFQMLTGELPWNSPEGEKDISIRMEKARDYYPPSLKRYDRRLTNELYNIIFRLTVTRPEDRKYWYKSIDELIADVKAAVEPPAKEPKSLVEGIRGGDKRFEHKDAYAIESEMARQRVFTQPWFAALLAGVSTSVLGAVIAVTVLLATNVI